MTPRGQELAVRARLVYVDDETPGITRARNGKGFSYRHPDGRLVDDPGLRKWIASLAIPPAWTGVWICPDPDGHILATGRDAEGRKQYIYHPEWERVRDEAKFERLGVFAADLPHLRRSVDADLRRPGLPPTKVVALVVALLDRTLIRVGNRQYADENESYGLTTLVNEHARVEGADIRFSFTGKAGKEHEVALRDPRLARLVARCQELDGQTLFSCPAEDGLVTITSSHVNEYLREQTGTDYTAKDFRTWGGTTVAAAALAEAPAPGEDARETEQRVLEALDVVAERLGNTRAIARSSYVHPAIPDSYRSGLLHETWRRSRRGRWVSRPESLVRTLLAA